jgi:hypothetical protein
VPIVGNLSEFPLPEVLLLIGCRTGRLRLYDVPEFAVMELDLSEGHAHALHLGGSFLTETFEIVSELSVIVETGEGMFEFDSRPVISVRRNEPLPISQLVMLLVLHVDEKLARQRALMAPEIFYMLATPAPEIWIDPELNLFYHKSWHLLGSGVRPEDLAEYLGLDHDLVRLNLSYLRQLGLVQIIDSKDVVAMQEKKLEEEISKKSDEFQLAVEASDLIRRSGRLLKLPSRKNL